MRNFAQVRDFANFDEEVNSQVHYLLVGGLDTSTTHAKFLSQNAISYVLDKIPPSFYPRSPVTFRASHGLQIV